MILRKILIPSNKEWAHVPIDIYQDLEARKILKVEVLGDIGSLVLYPTEQNHIVQTLPGVPEPTTIDLQWHHYRCPIGESTFTLQDRNY
jgi:hypothetical protein